MAEIGVGSAKLVIMGENMNGFRDRHTNEDGGKPVGDHVKRDAARRHRTEGGCDRGQHHQIRQQHAPYSAKRNKQHQGYNNRHNGIEPRRIPINVAI
jgi:hypothetical protein